MKKFIEAELEVTKFETENVMVDTVSNEIPDNGDEWEGEF